jgi:hypothetical protein
MRDTHPRLMVLWGKYDPSFEMSEPASYQADVPNAEIHMLEAGHFALDTAADQIADLVRSFLWSADHHQAGGGSGAASLNATATRSGMAEGYLGSPPLLAHPFSA